MEFGKSKFLGPILIATTVPETFATILKYQAKHLAQYFTVEIVTSPGGAFKKVSEAEGLRMYGISMVRGINILKDIRSLLAMAWMLRKAKPMLVHSYTPKAGLIMMLAAFVCGVPVRVHTFTGLIFPTERGFKQTLLIWIDRLICACATHVVPEGLGVKRDLRKFSITRKQLNVIGHGNIAGIDTSYFSLEAIGVRISARNFRERLGIRDDEFVFCFVGRLNRDKGISELLQAFSVDSIKGHLVLVGEVDLSAPITADTLAVIDSHPRVHAVGFLEDVRAAMGGADVLVLPSYREGFPNVVLQAGAMELPVIATDISGCNEVIETGFNGWLVPPRNVPVLQAAMQEATLTDSSERRGMGLRARGRIQERFEQREHWERMVRFYRGLLVDAL